MPPREFQTPRDKREELKTYRELALRRDLKTVRQRRRVAASGAQRVLGDGSESLPYLIVASARYREVRRETQRRLLMEAREAHLNLGADALLDQLQPRIEALTHAQLAQEADHEALRHIPVEALGRALTDKEREQFAATQAAGETPGVVRRRNRAHAALNQALGHIEQRQTHNPARYQTIWAQLVGPDAGQQTFLERVDPTTQIAYFRCFNSVLSADLQRRAGLAQKLAKALGVPVRQLRARF